MESLVVSGRLLQLAKNRLGTHVPDMEKKPW
jgi:hypothetical protein